MGLWGRISSTSKAALSAIIRALQLGYKFAHYQKLVDPLIDAVQELAAQKDAEIMQLKADNKAMERRLETLERKLN